MSRLTFLVDEDTQVRFDDAKEKLGLTHGRDAFEHALLLLEEALRAVEDNKSFGIIDAAQKHYEILRVPRIEAYRTRLETEKAAVNA